MKLIDIYSQIKNPLDDPEIIKSLIDGCGRDMRQPMTTTIDIKTTTAKTPIINGVNFKDINVKRFNLAKNILIATAQQNNVFGALANKLKAFPDITEISDIDKIRENVIKGENEKFIKFADDLFFNQYVEGTDSYGIFFDSLIENYNINQSTTFLKNIEHRLYLNVHDNLAATTLIDIFIEKCRKYNVPYHLKTFLEPARNDNVVIYASNETLITHIQIIKELEKERPDIFLYVNDPPILTGKIDKFIGYASEIGKGTSYNGIFNKIMKNFFEQTLRKWIQNNTNIKIHDKDIIISLEDYLSKMISQYISEDYHYSLMALPNFLKLTDGSAIENTKENLEYIDNEFVQNVYNKIRPQISELLNKYIEDEYIADTDITFPYKDKHITLYCRYLIDYIRYAIASLAKHIPGFREEVKRQISEGALAWGYDIDKICFHKETIKSMIEYDKEQSSLNSKNSYSYEIDNKSETADIMLKPDECLIFIKDSQLHVIGYLKETDYSTLIYKLNEHYGENLPQINLWTNFQKSVPNKLGASGITVLTDIDGNILVSGSGMENILKLTLVLDKNAYSKDEQASHFKR